MTADLVYFILGGLCGVIGGGLIWYAIVEGL